MKKALLLNAAFSGLSGIALVLFQTQLASLFEIEAATVFWIVGLALIFFASTILYEVRKQNTFRILWIIIQDMLWVFGSIYMLIANPFLISQNGNYMIAAVAIIVFFMAINQALALMRERKIASVK